MADSLLVLGLAAFHDSIHDYETVGDSILAFQNDFGVAYCEHCGDHIGQEETICQCSACKTVSYCSKECQAQDWTEGGHKIECEAIQGEHTWEQYADELASPGTDASSVTSRHYSRFAALAAAAAIAPEEGEIAHIEGRGGGGGGKGRHGGGGGHGWGGGVGGGRFKGGGGGGGGGAKVFFGGGGGGSFRGAPVPHARRGGGGLLGGLGRTLANLVVGPRWIDGRGFGGHRYGYWNGWSFPWIYRRNRWFPWWYYIDPVYYAQGAVYVDPDTGERYGVPPAPPGHWGARVPPPPQGFDGYDRPPEFVGGELISAPFDQLREWAAFPLQIGQEASGPVEGELISFESLCAEPPNLKHEEDIANLANTLIQINYSSYKAHGPSGVPGQVVHGGRYESSHTRGGATVHSSSDTRMTIDMTKFNQPYKPAPPKKKQGMGQRAKNWFKGNKRAGSAIQGGGGGGDNDHDEDSE